MAGTRRSRQNNGVWNFAISATHMPLVKALHNMGDELASARVPLLRFAEHLAGVTGESFSGEKNNDGKAWPKRRGEGSRALLVLSGKMRDTVTSKTKGVIALGNKTLIFGIRRSPRAIAHNFGRRKVQQGNSWVTNLPPRQFMPFEESTRDALIDIVSDWQKEVITRAERRFAAM